MSLRYQDVCCRPDGSLAYVYGTETAVVCEGAWARSVPREPLDLRCGILDGAVVAIWKDGDPNGGTVRFTVDGEIPIACGPAFGTNSVCVGPEGLYIVRGSTRIEVVDLQGHTVRWMLIPATSQGIRDITPDGELRLGDDWFSRTVNDLTLYQPVQRGTVMVGQADPEQIAGVIGQSKFTVRLGLGFEPHLAQIGSSYAICARPWATPVLVPPYPPFQGGAVPPEPVPVPPNPGGPVKLPDHVFATLQQVRAKYPTPLGNQGASVLNEVAWIHRAEGYGLQVKGGGTTCPQPRTGTLCSCDRLRDPSHSWDVLIDAEGLGVPAQTDSDPTDGTAPVPPVQTSSTPIPIPPTPTPEPPSDHEQRIRALEARMMALEASALRYGQLLALRTSNGHLVCAEDGGGGVVNATRTAIGDWEKFRADKP